MIALSSQNLNLVKEALRRYVPDKEVWIFGSRIGSTHKKYSDLDLVIISNDPVPQKTMAMLRESFSESKLPMQVDLMDWADISTEFRSLIRRKYEVIQQPV